MTALRVLVVPLLFSALLAASCARQTQTPIQDISVIAVIHLAEQRNVSAECELARREAKGIGVARDERKAVTWYEKAAAQGSAAAANSLGLLYEDGHIVPNAQEIPQSHKAAMTWFQKAAAQGFAAAENNLGIDSYNGGNTKQAAIWFKSAADQGYGAAADNLGILYASGSGVPKSKLLAESWFSNAAAHGVNGFYGLVTPDNLGVQAGYVEKTNDLIPYRKYHNASGDGSDIRIYRLPDGCLFGVEVDRNGNIVEIGADLVGPPACIISPLASDDELGGVGDYGKIRSYALADVALYLQHFDLNVSLIQPADLRYPAFSDIISAGSAATENVSYMWSFDDDGPFQAWRRNLIERDGDTGTGVCVHADSTSVPGRYLSEADGTPAFMYIGVPNGRDDCGVALDAFMDPLAH